ncbi:PEGA domain-containing protein [Lutibacter sp.]
MKKKLLFLISFLLISYSYSQSKIQVTANYADAEIFKVIGNEVVKPSLGFGSIVLKLNKKELNKIRIVKEGFESVTKQYPRTTKWPKKVQVNLENRVVKISTQPFDAVIYVEGNNVGTRNCELVILKDAIVTVELKKKGFKTVSKVYYNKEGKDIPPLKDELQLKDRVVEIKVSPADAEIFVDKNSVGIGSATVIIPNNECVLLEINKEGYLGSEKVFCNKENDPEPPHSFKFSLTDRLVKISTTPDDSEIKVDGKIVGVGSYDLKVPKNKCVEVIASKSSYLTLKKNYCNSDDYQEPPTRDHLELKEDEAIKNSISTDFANVNFTIAVREGMAEIEAWKLLSSIVTTEFDVLEVIDRETGYLRTAWQVQSFNGESTIRTRIVVKLGDSNPLKYIMKISSERAEGIASVKDDQEFEEWSRILKKYKNIIEEAQSRL